LFACRAWSEELPWEKKLPFKEATIHYEITGMEQGKETLYIRDYGKRQAKHHQATSTIMGTTQKTHTVQITDPDWLYTYDLVEKKGGKTTNPNKLYLTEYNKLTGDEKKNFEKNAKELGTSMMGQFGGSVKQKGSQILGYDCDVTTVGGISTVYSIHGTGIPLRAETSVMGMNNVYSATKVDTGSATPDSAFVPPADIVAVLDQNMETMMTDMIKHTVDTLKKPDGAKQMQQAGPMGMMGGAGGMQKMMQKEMQDEGMSPEEQQDMMRQMNEAMQQMQKRQQPKK
jgi:hypothetical protein